MSSTPYGYGAPFSALKNNSGSGFYPLFQVDPSSFTITIGSDGLPQINFTGSGSITGTVNFEEALNPFAPTNTPQALGNGNDDYLALQACVNNAIQTQNATIIIPAPIWTSKTILIPQGGVTGFQSPYIVSVNTSTSTLTLSQDPTGITGDPIQFNGACPTGISPSSQYYRYFPNPANRTLIQLYNTKANALVGGSTGRISITGTVVTTATVAITAGATTVTVADATLAATGVGIIFTLANGTTFASTQGGEYVQSVAGNVITLCYPTANTVTAPSTTTTVTYFSWVDIDSVYGGIKFIFSPGAGLFKHPNWTTSAGTALIYASVGSDIELHNGIFEGLSPYFIPQGVTGTIAGTNQITITGDTSWFQPGAAFTLGGGANEYYIDTWSSNVITAFQTNNSPTWPTGTFLIGRGISSGSFVGSTITGTSGQTTANVSSAAGLYPGLGMWFAGDTAGPHTIQTVGTPSGGVTPITFTPALNANLTTRGFTYLGGDDGIKFSSCKRLVVSNCKFYNFGDTAIRIISYERYYTSQSTQYPTGAVSSFYAFILNNFFRNCHQTDTTPNNQTSSGVAHVWFCYNVFEYLRGSCKFAARLDGQDDINVIGNYIKSSDNHGFEFVSSSNVKVLYNQITNVYNQGIFMYSNGRPSGGGLLGAGINGWAYKGLQIVGNVFDNVGQISNSSCVRIDPDGYADGTIFNYEGIEISGNRIRNITNTAHVGFNMPTGCYLGFRIHHNTFESTFQGLKAIQMLARSSTVSGFYNGIQITNNNISMNNSSGDAIFISGTSGSANMVNGVDLSGNQIYGTMQFGVVLDNVNNLTMNNSIVSVVGGEWININGDTVTNLTIQNNNWNTTFTFGSSWTNVIGAIVEGNSFAIGGGGTITNSFQNSCQNIYYVNNNETGGIPGFHQIPVNTNRLNVTGRWDYQSGTLAPTAGTWNIGDILNNTTASGVQNTQLYCTVAGTADTIIGSPVGTTNGSTNTVSSLNPAAISALAVGCYINLNGAWAGARKVTSINYTANSCVVSGATPSAVSGAAITYVAPTFVAYNAL